MKSDGLLVLEGVTIDFLDWFGPVWWSLEPIWLGWAQYPRREILSPIVTPQFSYANFVRK
jgi:hypothetical protein